MLELEGTACVFKILLILYKALIRAYIAESLFQSIKRQQKMRKLILLSSYWKVWLNCSLPSVKVYAMN